MKFHRLGLFLLYSKFLVWGMNWNKTHNWKAREKNVMKGKMLSLSCVFNLFYHVHFLIPCPISFAINVLSILQIPEQSFVMTESNFHLEVNFMYFKTQCRGIFSVLEIPSHNSSGSKLRKPFAFSGKNLILANGSFFLSHWLFGWISFIYFLFFYWKKNLPCWSRERWLLSPGRDNSFFHNWGKSAAFLMAPTIG